MNLPDDFHLDHDAVLETIAHLDRYAYLRSTSPEDREHLVGARDALADWLKTHDCPQESDERP